MSEEENISIYRRLIEAVNADDPDALDSLCAADMTDHNPFPGQPPGVEGLKYWMASVRSFFPDLRATIADAFAAGDRVAGRVIWSGTHEGRFAGVAPTGKRAEFTAMHIVRIENRKVVEWWGVADLLGAIQQLGAN
jgi:predicted ester cyclase